MKTLKVSTLIIILMSMLMASCGNSNTKSSKKKVAPVDSVKLFCEEVRAKEMLFSDIVKTDFLKNYIVKNYSEKFYNAILSNIRSDYAPTTTEKGFYTSYGYSNGSTDDNIYLSLEFRIREFPASSDIPVEIKKLGCHVNPDGSLRTGSWEKNYLVDDFDEKLLDYPYIETTLSYDKGYDNENLYVSFCKIGEGFEFRLAGDIADYGSIKDYKILIKQNEHSTKEIQIDEKFGKCLVIKNDRGIQDLLNFFNEYNNEKKMVITYENDWTEIYKKAVITSIYQGQDIFGAIYTYFYNFDINSL